MQWFGQMMKYPKEIHVKWTFVLQYARGNDVDANDTIVIRTLLLFYQQQQQDWW